MLDILRRYGITLAVFAALATGLTAVINVLTKPTIADQTARQQQALLDQVMPPEKYDNDLQKECYVVTDLTLGNGAPHRLYVARKAGQPVGAVIESTAPDGYSGSIQLLVGANFQGQVFGARVVEHHETPGLGDKIEWRVSHWINQFTGKQVTGKHDSRWAIKKEGGMFDQFTGATITPRAVIRSIKQAALYLEKIPNTLTTLPACGATL